MPPSFHGVPLAGVPCWLPKKLRPLPAHSITEVKLFEGSRWMSRYVSESGRRTPAPWTVSRHVAGSIVGVRVWSRTKKRSFGMRCPSLRTVSQRISALVPWTTNHSGGSGLTIGEAAWPHAIRGAMSGSEPAAASFSRSRLVTFSIITIEKIHNT